MKILSPAILLFLLSSCWLTAQEVSNKLRWADFHDSIRKDLRSDDAATRMAALEKFATEDYLDAAEFLLSMIENRRTSPSQAKRAAEILGDMRDSQAQKLVTDRVRALVKPDRYILRAYARLDPAPPDLEDKIFDAISKNPSPVQLADMLGLAADLQPTPNWLEPMLLGTLSSKNYHAARRAAAEALGKCGSALAVDTLIQFTKDKVIGTEARTALTRLTGERHWRDAAAWTTWWKDAKSGFQPAKIAEADLEKLVKELADADEAILDFYGIKLEGQYILFLLDSSGSMQGERMESLKRELLGLLQSMDESYRFGMVLFPMDRFPTRGIEPATARFKEKAARFIDKMNALGGTPLSESVEYAFEKVVEDHNVDTIYILTDGDPNRDPIDVRLMIKDLNEMLLTRIHTISIGQPSDFLKNVALDNGGKYAEIQ